MTPIQPQMTDERLDRLVRQLLTERSDDVAVAAMPAETMAAVVASHVRRGGIAERRTLLLVAAGLLIVLAAGAVAVGSGLIQRGPEPQPAPQPVVVPSLDATAPTPSDAATKPEHVFYTVFEATHVGDEGCTEANASRFGSCTSSRIWVADPDGSNARELFPESTDHRSILDVSAAGDALVLTAPAEVDGQPVAGTHLAELGPAGDVLATRAVSHEVLDNGCVGVCAFDSEFAFSPDGTRLTYMRASRQGEEDYATVIAIQDVATGEVIELESTRASGPDGSNGAPVWSPDGRHLLFTRDSIGVATPDHRLLDTATFLVDDDGSNLRQLTDTALSARDGAWSPDGSMIAFTSAIALARRGPVRQARELQRGQRRLHGARRRVGCSTADQLRAHARGPWRPCAGGRPCRRLDPRRADRLHRAPMGRRGRFDESAARDLDHGIRRFERAAGRWFGYGEPDGGGVRRLPVPARRVGPGVHGLLETRAMRLLVAVAAILFAACGSASPSVRRRPSLRADPSGAPATAAAASTAPADLVGEWERETRCEEIVAALQAAGLEKWNVEVAAGFVPGAEGPEAVEDPAEPCRDAVPLRHSHFFTADGQFGSRDQDGNQVDDGTYRIVDEGTFVVSKEFPDITFHYSIDGDSITFEPAIPECSPDCFEAAWSVSVAFPGHEWRRVESGS